MNLDEDYLLTFGEILIKIYEGAEVARKAWVDSDTKDIIYVNLKANGRPRLRMRFNDGTTGDWLPKQKEIFVSDWYVLRYK